MIGLAFFDPNVEPQQKLHMLNNLRGKEGSEDPPNRLDANGDYEDEQLSSFVTTNTKHFFAILGIDESFLDLPPESWNDNEQFMAAERIVKSLKVVNDSAARGVKLIQDYNEILTKNEEQKQYLLQVVQDHCELFPNSNKGTIVAGLTLTTNKLQGQCSSVELDSD